MKNFLIGLFLSLVTIASIASFSTKAEAAPITCGAGQVYSANPIFNRCVWNAQCASLGNKCFPTCTTTPGQVWNGTTCTGPLYRCIRPDGSYFTCATPATYFTCYHRQFYTGIWYHWGCGVTPFGWHFLIPSPPIYRYPFAPPRFNPPPVYISPPRFMPRPPIVFWNPRGGYVTHAPIPYYTIPRYYMPRYYVPRYYMPYRH